MISKRTNAFHSALAARVLVFHRIEADQVLQVDSLRAVLESVEAEVQPDLADSLLADAAFYGLFAEPVDLPRAVLIAAIACEVKVTSTLRRKVKPDSAELLDVLLANPRDWSLAAAALL